jgi:hypothetical protein
MTINSLTRHDAHFFAGVRGDHHMREITAQPSASIGDREFRTPAESKGAATWRSIAHISLAQTASSKIQFRSNARMMQ